MRSVNFTCFTTSFLIGVFSLYQAVSNSLGGGIHERDEKHPDITIYSRLLSISYLGVQRGVYSSDLSVHSYLFSRTLTADFTHFAAGVFFKKQI